MRASLSILAQSSTFLAGSFAPSSAEDINAWRLLVGDQKEAKLTVLDGVTGDELASYPLKGNVTHLVASESGKTAFAVQMEADAVDVVATGVTFSDHGEHSDIELEQPSHLVQLEGRRPVHAVSHGDEVLQFFDLQGEARVFAEQALLQGKPDYDTVKAAAPHHGVVVPKNDYGAAWRSLFRRHSRLWLQGRRFGRAPGGLELRSWKCWNTNLPAGQVGTLLRGKPMQFFLGNYGDDKVVVIDLSEQDPLR